MKAKRFLILGVAGLGLLMNACAGHKKTQKTDSKKDGDGYVSLSLDLLPGEGFSLADLVSNYEVEIRRAPSVAESAPNACRVKTASSSGAIAPATTNALADASEFTFTKASLIKVKAQSQGCVVVLKSFEYNGQTFTPLAGQDFDYSDPMGVNGPASFTLDSLATFMSGQDMFLLSPTAILDLTDVGLGDKAAYKIKRAKASAAGAITKKSGGTAVSFSMDRAPEMLFVNESSFIVNDDMTLEVSVFCQDENGQKNFNIMADNSTQPPTYSHSCQGASLGDMSPIEGNIQSALVLKSLMKDPAVDFQGFMAELSALTYKDVSSLAFEAVIGSNTESSHFTHQDESFFVSLGQTYYFILKHKDSYVYYEVAIE